MAAFVVAGRVDSAEYSRAEMLGDYLCASLPRFKVHKIPVDPSEWPNWMLQACEERGWVCDRGPLLVWRELIDRGGKGLLLGGLSDFERYAEHYYEVRLDMPADLAGSITEENVVALQAAQVEASQRVVEPPTNVCITNAAHPLAYHLVHQVCSSGLYSSQGGLAIRLLVNSLDEEEAAVGICMEAYDMALPHLKTITAHTSAKDAFADVHVAFLLDFPHHGVGPESSSGMRNAADNLKEASMLYHRYARILDFHGNKALRVVIAGSYAEIGVAMLAKTATSFAANRFTAPSELTSHQAKAIIASKLSINTSQVENIIICGRLRGEGTFADISQACVYGYTSSITGPQWYSRPIKECIYDHDWLSGEFHSLLLKRSSGVGYGSTGPIVAESVRLVQFLRHWIEGTKEKILSTVLYIDEQQVGLPQSVALSVPCKVIEGEICIPEEVGTILGEEARTQLNAAAVEIRNDLDTAMHAAEVHTASQTNIT